MVVLARDSPYGAIFREARAAYEHAFQTSSTLARSQPIPRAQQWRAPCTSNKRTWAFQICSGDRARFQLREKIPGFIPLDFHAALLCVVRLRFHRGPAAVRVPRLKIVDSFTALRYVLSTADQVGKVPPAYLNPQVDGGVPTLLLVLIDRSVGHDLGGFDLMSRLSRSELKRTWC